MPEFAARPVLASNDTRTIARELLATGDEQFGVALKGSPMKRAKRAGLKRNAAVVLGNVGGIEDLPALLASLGDAEPLVQEHAKWALDRIAARTGSPSIL